MELKISRLLLLAMQCSNQKLSSCHRNKQQLLKPVIKENSIWRSESAISRSNWFSRVSYQAIYGTLIRLIEIASSRHLGKWGQTKLPRKTQIDIALTFLFVYHFTLTLRYCFVNFPNACVNTRRVQIYRLFCLLLGPTP